MESEKKRGGTVPAPLRSRARRTPEAAALVGAGGDVLSYGALDAVVDRVAARLAAADVGRDTRVACRLPRTPAYVVLLLALWRRGAVTAPLPARTPPAGWPPLLHTVGAEVLIAEEQDAVPAFAEGLVKRFSPARFTGETGHGGAFPEPPPPVEIPAAPTPAHWPADRPMTLVFTSGSTGAPKAALHTAGNHYFSAEGSRQNLPLGPGDRWLQSLPLYHVGGLAVVLRCLWAGAAVVFANPEVPLATALRRGQVTHVSLVAAQLRSLLADASQGAPASLKAVLMGGGPVPPALVRAGHRAGLPLLVSYGLTEMTSQVTTTAPGDALDALLHTAGRLLRHRRVRIRPGPADEPGEILVRGRTRFAGYVEAGRLQKPFVEAFGESGWFATGDRGHIDAHGRLRVTGRLDRRFVSGGENIQPEEIEAALRRLPRVADAAVVSVAHEQFGRRPVAFVRAAEGDAFQPAREADDLRAALAETLPTFKVPDAFYAWPDEAAGAMKPNRQLLQRRARQHARERAE